jgi:outer membrane lipoprotein-sorting protein
MLAFARKHIKKLVWPVWLLLMLVPFWHWDPAVDPLAAAEPVLVPDAKVERSAREILDRMLAAYANARSYRDTAVIRTTWSGSDGFTTQQLFETAFVRDGGFRFDYVDQKERSLMRMLRRRPDSRMVVWGDNANARSWWTVDDGKVEDGTLGLAIAGASGVSGGPSPSVPKMLLPNTLGGSRLDELEGATVASVDSFRGHECYRLAGKWRNAAEELWIDRESSLLRRIRQVNIDDGETIEKITAYDPVINVDIPDEVFRFEPPK